MLLKKTAFAVLAGIFFFFRYALPAVAQGSCPDLYSRMMGAYQNEGPGSPRYNELRSRYAEHCEPGREGRGGAAAANAKSCGWPAKTRVSWGNEAKVTANVIGKCAS